MATGSYKEEFLELLKEEAVKHGYKVEDFKETKLGAAIIAHTGPQMYLVNLRKKN
jgi:fatty acid-binding protein DegV